MASSEPGVVSPYEALGFTIDDRLRPCFVRGGVATPVTGMRYTGHRVVLANADMDLNADARTQDMWAYTRVPRRAAL